MAVGSRDHLETFVELPHLGSAEEKRASWRQAMATLARARDALQPVPLEGINPERILQSVRTAFEQELVDDLDWLSPAAAASALYELASATPASEEKRLLGRRVLTRLYEGNVDTFIALAKSLALDSRKTLTGRAVQARIALALELPLGWSSTADGLALALLSQPELRREWLSEPSMGSLGARRLAARLLERAARASVQRTLRGDDASVHIFQDVLVREAWQRLLDDRELLVWRHLAVARGLLASVVQEMREEVEHDLDPSLSPTEWRRASVSLVAGMAMDPEGVTHRVDALLSSEVLRRDPGVAGSMIHGMARAGEAEPEAAEALLERLVRMGGIDAAEALVEVTRERVAPDFGKQACATAAEQLRIALRATAGRDDGRSALCRSLIDELEPSDGEPSLRSLQEGAMEAFVQKGAREAHRRALHVFQTALQRVEALESCRDDDGEGRQRAFTMLRELDLALFESSALSELLILGGRGGGASAAAAPLGDLFERINQWLLRRERKPIASAGAVPHLTLRLRRLRTLLHLADADGSYGQDRTGQRRERRLRTARLLLTRARRDASSPLRRVLCASLARTCDALLRDGVVELSDVLVALADHAQARHDLTTLSEATMVPELEAALRAYADLEAATAADVSAGLRARRVLDAMREVTEQMPWAGTLRVTALRGALLRFVQDLEATATARRLSDLSGGAQATPLQRLEASVYALAQLTLGARRRLAQSTDRDVPESGSVMRALALAVESAEAGAQADALDRAVDAVTTTMRAELPLAVAEAAAIVLQRISMLVRRGGEVTVESLIPPPPKDDPLPAWLPPSRTIGGFYVLRAIGSGGVGSVFVVKRSEERHDRRAPKFALKVPEYGASAAMTLSEEEFLRMFREEAGALLAVPDHPNIAGFVTFDAGAKPKPILVMELVEGPTLERVLERGDIDTGRALYLLDGIAAGLEAMHHVGVGHLDVKPGNVILRRQAMGNGEVLAPVLVDFGLAGRNLRPGCATGNYGSPEIWGLTPQGHRPRPTPADVYALGCVAFEVLTGNTLFDGDNELQIIHQHLEHDGYPPGLQAMMRERRLDLLCQLLGGALRRNPDERINVTQFRNGLRQIAPDLEGLQWPLLSTAA